MFRFFKYRLTLQLIVLLCNAVQAFGQTVVEAGSTDKEYNGRVKRAFIKAPVLLVNALTKNKNTDREKFEAIYNWVVKNIDYDYGIYFSGGGVAQPKIKRILKKRKGVCLDYAYLMDTMCYMAGVTNASVYGYAKDEVFDVNDSVYIDNHAWNAVKLDNLWYLYDVTWSKGFTYYRYTKFSKFIMNLKKRFTVKYIPKTIKQKKKRYFRKLVCGSYLAVDSAAHKITVYKKVYTHKLLRKFLSIFRIKIIRTYKEQSNTNYYLSDPKVFSIRHFPDDPDWSLLSQKSMRAFETDSAFYYLTDSAYIKQQRRGQSCGDCDNDVFMDELNKNTHMRKKSLAFNPRNRFITSLCEYNIGGIKFEESKPLEDSLAKVTMLDTSLAFMQHAKNSLWQALRNIETENYLQALKNRKKLSDLIDNNMAHSAFVRRKMDMTFRETKDIRDLESKIDMYGSKIYFRNRTINHYKKGRDIDRDAHRVLPTITNLNYQLSIKIKQVDSLRAVIAHFKTEFDNALPVLYNSLLNEATRHDSLVLPLRLSIKYRSEELLDNYKKKIVDVRKEIDAFEANYSNGIDSTIYKPADFCYATGNHIFQLIDERNRALLEGYKLRSQLVKFKEIAPGDLDTYIEELLSENAGDLCWIRSNNNYLQGIFYGFKALLGKQADFDGMLYAENKVEVRRFLFIDKELRRRQRQYQNILANNRRVVNIRTSAIRKDKNEFLKKLRKQRREERLKK